MKKTTAILTAREALIFRDGRPFGMPGVAVGGSLNWPMPSTLAGMMRSAIGLHRSADYFSGPGVEQNRLKVLKLSLAASLPVSRSPGAPSWLPMFPAPADAVLLDSGDRLAVKRFSCCRPTPTVAAVTECWPNWLLPCTGLDKPAADRPPFWREELFRQWLREEDIPDVAHHDLGSKGPMDDSRIHVAIDPATFTSDPGKLFESPGRRFARSQPVPEELGIALWMENLEDSDALAGPVPLGGDRRVAFAEPYAMPFPQPDPELVHAWSGQRYLRLVLVTPGDFGAWAPAGMTPDPIDFKKETPWWPVPGTPGLRIRLCGAFVPPWIPLSGWDYAKRCPKAMRKIVPAGSVYVVEVEKPEDSAKIAGALWGTSLNASTDGFGVVVVGCAKRLCENFMATQQKAGA